jgi:hypothetical protein
LRCEFDDQITLDRHNRTHHDNQAAVRFAREFRNSTRGVAVDTQIDRVEFQPER